MATIKFIQLSQEKYNTLSKYIASNIYFTTDTHRIYKGDTLYSCELEILTTAPTTATGLQANRLYVVPSTGDMYINNNGTLVQVGGQSGTIATIEANISSNTSAISANSASIAALDSQLNTETTGIAARLTTAQTNIETKLASATFSSYSSETASTLSGLRTDVDSKLASATFSSYSSEISSTLSSMAANISSQAVSLSSADGENNILKVYTITQGGETVGTINIPKDLVVTSGSVVKGTWSGSTFTQSESGTGTALKLVIANQTDPVYINTLDLVKDHTGDTAADGVITVDISETNVITATIADGSIESSKLSAAVQSSLGLANSALQSGSTYYTDIKVDSSDGASTLAVDMNAVKGSISNIALSSSSSNGYVSFTNGAGTTVDVPVKGLGSAAFTDSTAYDVAGAAAQAKADVVGTASDAPGTLTLNGLSSSIAILNSDANTANSIAYLIAASQANSSSYTNNAISSALSWETIS